MQSRRDLLTGGAGLAVAGALPALASESSTSGPLARQTCLHEELSLDGEWLFSRDPDGRGIESIREWTQVRVPHTWQVTPGTEEYRGLAWYRRKFAVSSEWRSSAIRIEFEAVFHSATVWVNGALAGSHLRKGYTAFVLDITSFLRYGAENVIVVRVDSAFDDAMLPRGRSSDWAHDGGIYRPVRLIITAPVFIERLAVDADGADIGIHATVRNSTTTRWRGRLGCRVVELETGKSALEVLGADELVLEPGERRTLTLGVGTIAEPRLWHFDHPHLYAAQASLHQDATVVHELDATFGIRTIEVRDGALHLNGEKIRLMGVERMAGSNPEFGMAEPAAWIAHDHDDLKNLNCTLTRVHWQQDRRVLDYCDRHGILLQSEVPAWGWETFQGMAAHPLPELMQNGLEQLREMIERDRNHPCIIAWGLCNEINGQDSPAYEFAQRLYAQAKQLDPRRLCSYAANSLQTNPGKDVAGLMDFIECNEYFGTWTAGTPEDLRRHLLEIHRTFPGKPIVISEYGYCACVPERPEDDARRIEILRDHTRVCRELDFVAGLIFFCYNDYRTHVGDKGSGATLQRVHGVVDLFGQRKPSYDVLREESSPVEWLRIAGPPGDFVLTLKARRTIPAHTLTGYILRGVLYGDGDIPLERRSAAVPAVAPGEQVTLAMQFTEQDARRIVFDVLRPTAFSAWTEVWRAQPAERRPTEFGVCFHHAAFGDEYTPAATAVLDDLRSAGTFWIRGDFQEPAKDARFAADMQRKGIQVLALLPWYSTNAAKWSAYVKKQVAATPTVPAWEITNEPEMKWWGGPIPPATYMKMLREAHSIIKAANKDARIVGPAVGATAEGVAYLQALIDRGLLDFVDGISVHYYVFHKSLQLAQIKRVVAGRKPLWITETGWTTTDQEGGEDAQRTYIRTHYDRTRGILATDPAVAVIFNYELNDEHHPAVPGKDDGWGLTYGPEGDFGKKAAYDDFKKLLQQVEPTVDRSARSRSENFPGETDPPGRPGGLRD